MLNKLLMTFSVMVFIKKHRMYKFNASLGINNYKNNKFISHGGLEKSHIFNLKKVFSEKKCFGSDFKIMLSGLSRYKYTACCASLRARDKYRFPNLGRNIDSC